MAPSLDLAAPDEAIYAFCRAHSWRVWIKGPYHDAVAVEDWRHLEQVRAWMKDGWQTDRVSVQAHVRGYEESVCLAAFAGRGSGGDSGVPSKLDKPLPPLYRARMKPDRLQNVTSISG